MVIQETCIGYVGKSFVKRKRWVEWASKKLKSSMTLLGKQVWRMINNPRSLCFRVFKAIFFPNCSILEVKDSIAGSYAWKSILSARDVIRKGMVWRIGDGQSVRVKKNKWLPKGDSSSIISPLTTILPETRVPSLKLTRESGKQR